MGEGKVSKIICLRNPGLDRLMDRDGERLGGVQGRVVRADERIGDLCCLIDVGVQGTGPCAGFENVGDVDSCHSPSFNASI